MKSFIRFTEADYILEDQIVCLTPESVDACEVNEQGYKMPVKPNDIIKFIINTFEVTASGAQVADLRIALVKCGIQVALNIGVIEDHGDQLFCTVTIPGNVADGSDYQLVFYSIYNPIDCGDYAGDSLQDVIDTDIILGQILDCTLNDFL